MYRRLVELAQLEHDVARFAPLSALSPHQIRGRFAERGVHRPYNTSKASSPSHYINIRSLSLSAATVRIAGFRDNDLKTLRSPCVHKHESNDPDS
jgi:hypothetical protein